MPVTDVVLPVTGAVLFVLVAAPARVKTAGGEFVAGTGWNVVCPLSISASFTMVNREFNSGKDKVKIERETQFLSEYFLIVMERNLAIHDWQP